MEPRGKKWGKSSLEEGEDKSISRGEATYEDNKIFPQFSETNVSLLGLENRVSRRGRKKKRRTNEKKNELWITQEIILTRMGRIKNRHEGEVGWRQRLRKSAKKNNYGKKQRKKKYRQSVRKKDKPQNNVGGSGRNTLDNAGERGKKLHLGKGQKKGTMRGSLTILQWSGIGGTS